MNSTVNTAGTTRPSSSASRWKGSMNARLTRLCMGLLLSGLAAPAVGQIGFLPFEHQAELLDALFDLGGRALANFEHERRSAAQIQRHERLEHVLAVDRA